MARKNVAPILEKDFVMLKIDTDRSAGGKDLLKAQRKGRSGGIPWFIILDAEGKERTTSTGPDGNIGCPYTDEEIAAFADILGKVTEKIDEKDLEALKASLKAQQKK